MSCVVGFDWHSSGTTTTFCGALKEALKSQDLGIGVAGGKGKTSRKTPEQINQQAENLNICTKKIEHMQKSSKMAAKVDSALVQDSYELYHHMFIFTQRGKWTVVQQGLNPAQKQARRYHWLSTSNLAYVQEPHTGICCDIQHQETLDLTNKNNKDVQKCSVDLLNDNPEHLKKYIKPRGQLTLDTFKPGAFKELDMPAHHEVLGAARINFRTLQQAHDYRPKNYEDLVALKGVGAKTLRALALISELIYGTPITWHDPAKYSFAVGGKDGHPYPVHKPTYDNTITTIRDAIEQAELGKKAKIQAIQRLRGVYSNASF
jgi:hypothetical protein